MIFQLIGILLLLFGLILIVIGICLWKKKKLHWISVHSNVRRKDVSAFTRMVGQSTIGIGVSVGLWGFCWIIRRLVMGPVLFGMGFVFSMVLYFRAQKRYN